MKKTQRIPAIKRIVDFNDGPTALSRKINGRDTDLSAPVPQQIQEWAARGWATADYIPELLRFAPEGVTADDLFADRAIVEGKPLPPPLPMPVIVERRVDERRSSAPGRRRYDKAQVEQLVPVAVPDHVTGNHVFDRRNTEDHRPGGPHVERRKR